MFEWWQALVLLGAGTVLGLGAGYVQRWWTRSDVLEAEKREAIREHRRERIGPVQNYIEAERKHITAQTLRGTFDVAWERNLSGVKDKYATREEYRQAGENSFELLRSGVEEQAGFAHSLAMSAAPTREIHALLVRLTPHHIMLLIGRPPETAATPAGTYDAAQSVEAGLRALAELVEQYVTDV